MAAKWADYAIVAVRPSQWSGVVASLDVREDLGSQLGYKPNWLTRTRVIEMMEAGVTFVTATRDNNQGW